MAEENLFASDDSEVNKDESPSKDFMILTQFQRGLEVHEEDSDDDAALF